MSNSWKSQIETWNGQIKAGQSSLVARELAEAALGKVPFDYLSQIANLSWRINRPKIGLRLLFPELRRQRNLSINANPELFTEYAACLLEVGAISEAERILADVGGKAPRARFYQALSLFKKWDYETVCEVLEKYLDEAPSGYHGSVVRVNLAAAYVNTERWTEAFDLLEGLKSDLKDQNHLLLLGNCFEIESQIHFHRGEHREALEKLSLGEKLLDETRNMGWLYCKKWQLINSFYLSHPRDLGEVSQLVSELRRTALGMLSWETLREIDFHWGLVRDDHSLVRHVYFGTPSAKYRDRMTRAIANHKTPIGLGEEYVLRSEKEDALEILDLKATLIGGSLGGISSKRLLQTLASDFYAPFRVGELFSILFQNEFFNLDVSPDRVYQVAGILREWLTTNAPGIRVEGTRAGYFLHLDERAGIKIGRDVLEYKLDSAANVHLLHLTDRFGAREFSSTELSTSLKMSTRTANRILSELKTRGQVTTSGKGRFTRFKLVS